MNNNSFPELENALEMLKEMENDGLVEINGNEIKITEAGRAFHKKCSHGF
jgi:oxygen-independent coproporphyrinogen-3 oxidase